MNDLLMHLASGHFLLPYLLVFGFLIMCGLGVPIPEDITLIAAGIASFYGYGNVYAMILVAFAGILMGDSLIFYMGRKFEGTVRRNRFFQRLVPDAAVEYIEKKLERHGNKLVFAARFMPGLRAPVYFTAGLMKIKFAVFFFYDFMAALISVPAIIYSVYYFGENIDAIVRAIKRIQHGLAFLAVLMVGAIAFHSYLSYRKIRAQAEAAAVRD